jgi:hypothetical protein
MEAHDGRQVSIRTARLDEMSAAAENINQYLKATSNEGQIEDLNIDVRLCEQIGETLLSLFEKVDILSFENDLVENLYEIWAHMVTAGKKHGERTE